MRTLNEQEKQIIGFVLEEKLGCTKEESLNAELSIANDLGADSLDRLEICFQIEKEFNISIPDIDFEEVKTIQDLYSCVEKFL